MFNAPDIITRINDIAQIYMINDQQCDDLERAIDGMDANLFLDTMDETMMERWESILSIVPAVSDTPTDRRQKIKSRVISPAKSTYRGVIKLVTARLGNDLFSVIISEANSTIEILLHKTHRLRGHDVEELLEEILPLDYTYFTEVDWNPHSFLTQFRHEDLSMHTHEELRYF